MPAEWKNKTGNRGSVVVGPLIKGERHEISTTDIEPGEWLEFKNFYPTYRGLRRGPDVSAANTSGTNSASTAIQAFQRADTLRNYVCLGSAAGYSMGMGRDGFISSQMVWSSLGVATGRNITITVAGDTLTATIAGTYTVSGVAHAFYFDATFMLEPGDRIFSPVNPALTSLIKAVSSTTLTFDASEHAVPATVTQLCILYKWQSNGFLSNSGYFLDYVHMGDVADTGRASSSQQPTALRAPNLVVTSLGRPLMISTARDGQTAYSARDGFEGMLSLRDDTAGAGTGASFYPLDTDTVVKGISARTLEMFRGFLYVGNTREVAYASATASAWVAVAYSLSLNRYAAIAANSNICAVTSGSVWIQRALPRTQNWSAICWSTFLAKYVAVANGSEYGAYSADGDTWTEFTISSSSAWSAIVSIETMQLMAIASSSGVIYTSHDLVAWARAINVSAGGWRGIATDGAYLANAVGNTATANWLSAGNTSSATDLPSGVVAQCWNATLSKFIAIRLSSGTFYVYSSSNGATWSAIGSFSGSGYTHSDTTSWRASLVYNATYSTMTFIYAKRWTGDDTEWYRYHQSFVVRTSADGATWTTRSSIDTEPAGAESSPRMTPICVNSDNGDMLMSCVTLWYPFEEDYAAQYKVFKSTNGGETWSSVHTFYGSAGYNYYMSALSWNTTDSVYVAGFTDKGMSTSPTGATWTAKTDMSYIPYGIAWSPTLSLYAISTSHGIYSSTALGSYTLRESTTDVQAWMAWESTLHAFIKGDGRAISYDGITYYSGTSFYDDARNVPYAYSSTLMTFVSGYYTGSKYGYATLHGTATTMPSASDWRGIAYHAVAAVYVAVAYASNAAAYSSDGGATWSAKTLPSTANWTAVCASSTIANKFVAVASSTTGASSTDGSTWTARTLSESGSYASVCYGATSGYFMAVANGNTVNTYSTDGTTWSDVSLFANILWQQYGNRIRWSYSGAAPLDCRNFSNALNYIDLPEQNSEIVKLLSDGQRLIAYMSTAIYYAVATGDATLPFTFLKLETGNVGLAAQLGVCRVASAHVFAGRNNIYLLDNLQLTAIGDPIADVTIRKLANPLLTQCFYDETANGVIFGFAVDSTTNIDQIWVLKLDTKTWSCLRSVRVIRCVSGYYVRDDELPYRHRAFAVSAGVAVLEADEVTESSYEAKLVTGDMHFGYPDQIKEFFRLKFNIDENEFGYTRTASILFTVSYSTDFGNTYRQLSEQLRIPPNQQEGYVNFRAIGNHIRFKFVSSSSVAPYTITSYTIDMKMLQPAQTLKLAGGQI